MYFFLSTSFLFWFSWKMVEAWGEEKKKREALDEKLKEVFKNKFPNIYLPPTISVLEHGLVAYALAQRLEKANAYIIKAEQAIEETNKVKAEHEAYISKTATCLANFGDIPDKWNDGSILHKAIREALAKAKAA